MRIKVEEIEPTNAFGQPVDSKIEIVKLDNGNLMNRGGRSLPF